MSVTLTVKSIKKKRIAYLAGAFIALLVTGLIYAWSMFAVHFGDAFPEYSPYLSRVFQVSIGAFCLSALLSAQITKRTSPKVSLVAAAALLGIGFTLTALTAHLSVVFLFLFYAVVAASGVGFAYNATVSVIIPWWPDKVGSITGILMLGFGIASLVLGSLANALIVSLGWQSVFFLIAAVGFVAVAAFGLLVKVAPQNIANLLSQGKAVAHVESADSSRSATKNQDILKTKTYWLIIVWFTMMLSAGLTLLGSSSQGLAAIAAARGDAVLIDLALLVGLVATMNGLGRIVIGYVLDKAGLTTAMWICSLTMMVCMGGLALSFSLESQLLYVAMAILAAFAYGGCPVLCPLIARERYALSAFPKNTSLLNLALVPAALLNIVLVSVFGAIQATAESAVVGQTMYVILLAMVAVSLVITVLFSRSFNKDLRKIEAETQLEWSFEDAGATAGTAVGMSIVANSEVLEPELT